MEPVAARRSSARSRNTSSMASFSIRRSHRLQSPRFKEAEVAAPVEDDVIQQSDAHDDARRLELRRHVNVGR